MSYNFFQNKECEWFPCHSTQNKERFSCLMCFCPLYPFEDCGGKYKTTNNGVKDCSDCLIPHHRHDYVIDKLKEQTTNNKKETMIYEETEDSNVNGSNNSVDMFNNIL